VVREGGGVLVGRPRVSRGAPDPCPVPAGRIGGHLDLGQGRWGRRAARAKREGHGSPGHTAGDLSEVLAVLVFDPFHVEVAGGLDEELVVGDAYGFTPIEPGSKALFGHPLPSERQDLGPHFGGGELHCVGLANRWIVDVTLERRIRWSD